MALPTRDIIGAIMFDYSDSSGNVVLVLAALIFRFK
jgi:hypothetical protein